MLREGSVLIMIAAQAAFGVRAYAGAWTLPKKDAQIIITTVYDSAEKSYDSGGNQISGTDFSKIETRLYGEYGLTDSVMLVVNTGLETVSLDSPGQPKQSYNGLSRTGIYLQKRLYASHPMVISAQIGTIFKSGGENIPGAVLGDGATDYEARLLIGRSLTFGKRQAFAEAQSAYRVRGGNAADEWRLDFTAGLEWTPDIKLMTQVFMRESIGKSRLPDYQSVQIQPSLVFKRTNGRSHQIGVFSTVSGRSIVRENAIFYAVWQSF